MKTFQRFLRESYELLPGTLLLIVQGGGFNRRIQYGVTTGRVVSSSPATSSKTICNWMVCPAAQ